MILICSPNDLLTKQSLHVAQSTFPWGRKYRRHNWQCHINEHQNQFQFYRFLIISTTARQFLDFWLHRFKYELVQIHTVFESFVYAQFTCEPSVSSFDSSHMRQSVSIGACHVHRLRCLHRRTFMRSRQIQIQIPFAFAARIGRFVVRWRRLKSSYHTNGELFLILNSHWFGKALKNDFIRCYRMN